MASIDTDVVKSGGVFVMFNSKQFHGSIIALIEIL